MSPSEQYMKRVYVSASPETQKQMRERGMTPWIQTAPDRVILTDDDREMCRVCGEYVTLGGSPCKRCERSMEDDKLERESGR